MAEKLFDVVVVGELNIDLVLWNVPMPEYEKEFLAQDMRFAMGSSSAITAHNLSSIGSRVGFLGKVGNDNFGDFMIRHLNNSGVDTSNIIRDGSLQTGATIVIANPPQKALLTYMGAMTDFTINDINWEYISQAHHLHLGCFFLQTGIRKDVHKLFAQAKEMGLTTSLDTNWDPDDIWGKDLRDALNFTDIFFPNEEEAMRIAHTESLEEAINKLGTIVKVLVVKRGAEGAILYDENDIYTHHGFNLEAVETTGAGDSFNAGFLHEFIKGSDWEKCLKSGNACGAIAVTEIGGTEAFKDREKLQMELTKFLNSE